MESFFNRHTIKDLLTLICISLAITFLIWLPHLFKLQNFWGLNFSNGFDTIYRNFDGLEYIIIAKTFYSPQLLAQIPQPLPASYFPSHFVGFPILIAIFAPLLGYLKSMLFVSIFFTTASTIAFYFLIKDFKLTNHPLWLSILFLILPARWVIVHSIGSPEPMFIFFTIATIYFFKKFEDSNQKIFLLYTGIMASLAQLTRPPGILIFIALFLYLLNKQIKKKNIKNIILLPISYFPLFLVPLTLFSIFYLFQIQMGDFFAYFHSGDNIHLTIPPFQVFNKYQFWVGDIWLEDIIYIFILTLLGGLMLLKTNLKVAGYFVLTYFAATILVAHRDIARYILPTAPFILIAFEKVLISKEFKIVMAILATAIYFYSQNFLIENVVSVSNLSVFD